MLLEIILSQLALLSLLSLCTRQGGYGLAEVLDGVEVLEKRVEVARVAELVESARQISAGWLNDVAGCSE